MQLNFFTDKTRPHATILLMCNLPGLWVLREWQTGHAPVVRLLASSLRSLSIIVLRLFVHIALVVKTANSLRKRVNLMNKRSTLLLALVCGAMCSTASLASGAHFSTVSVEHKMAPGGANQVKGTKGKVGDWFFDGKWRFRVIKIERPDVYHYQFNPLAGSDKPSGPNDQLLVFYCTMKNGMSSSDQPILSSAGLASQATAVTDDQGTSYPPIDFDSRNGSVVPGGAKNFAVIFSVPKSANLSELIFTI